MIWALLYWAAEFLRSPSFTSALTIFAMIPMIIVGGALGVAAVKWTSIGTVLLFWPLCRCFPERTKWSLAAFSAVGAVAGAGLSLIINDWPSLNGDGSPSPPGLLGRLHIGVSFGMGTAMMGWGLMPERPGADEG